MADQLNSFSLTGVAAALAQAIGVEAPAQSEPANAQLSTLVKNGVPGGKVDRILMYNPDAVAMWVYQKYTHLFNDAVQHASLALPLQTVMPSVTPVCFGTMYTGAYPETHGIRKYEKPVIRIDTLFDALIRAGKKCAIIGDPACSLSHIFLEREMDYFRIEEIAEANAKAAELIEKDEHDLIVIYNGNYDSVMHKTGPESEESIAQLKDNVASFDMLVGKVKECWKEHNTLYAFAMDHGCHEIDGGCGSHGLDMPEDLNILHLYGLNLREN
ncbi:MAG: alkaline phosphatase family protein [Eubacteriales bacterium]|nr:alkaline phosphatase family protein [Eubacteriales bacterium]